MIAEELRLILGLIVDKLCYARVAEIGIAKAHAGVQRQSFATLIVAQIDADLENLWRG